MDTVELIKIQSMFDDLYSKIETLEKNKNVKPEPTRSEDIKELADALAKAQLEMKTAEKDKVNSYYKTDFADIDSVTKASRPYLNKHGLSITQQLIHQDDGQFMLVTSLLHNSGQWINSRVRVVPPKTDVQCQESTTSFLARMSYATLTGTTSGLNDDDGEASVATSRELFAKGVALNKDYNPKNNAGEVISQDQLRDLEYELRDWPDIAESILDSYKIKNLADIPKERYRDIREKLIENINARLGKQKR